MKLVFHRDFTKAYRKLSQKVRLRAQEQLFLFESDPFGLKLNNHPLKGRFSGFRSINITGDMRAVYEMVSDDTAYFVAIGSHSELYH
jgi:addiction module RelE/StbE family toxin